MRQIHEAAAAAAADTLDAGPTDTTETAIAEDAVATALSQAADAVEQHVPEGPFKPLAHSALQMAIMFAIKGIFRRR